MLMMLQKVPCRCRVASLDQNYTAGTEVDAETDGEEGWLATHENANAEASFSSTSLNKDKEGRTEIDVCIKIRTF